MVLSSLQSFYLPWAMLALDVIFGSPLLPGLLGIMIGHLYYFLSVLHPLATGKNYLKTPKWVYPFTRFWPNNSQFASSYINPCAIATLFSNVFFVSLTFCTCTDTASLLDSELVCRQTLLSGHHQPTPVLVPSEEEAIDSINSLTWRIPYNVVLFRLKCRAELRT